MKQTVTAANKSTASSVVGVPANRILAVWKHVWPVIKSAVIQNGGYEEGDVLKLLTSRQGQLWLSITEDNDIEAAMVTMIEVYPRMKACLLLFLAGRDVENWLPYWDQFEDWARAQGCNEIRFIGRKGWAKIKPDFDTETLYRKRLGVTA